MAPSPKPQAPSPALCLKEKLRQYPFLFKFLHFANILRIHFKYVFYVLCYLVRNLFKGDVIFTQCWIKLSRYKLVPRNWGDDINKFFFEYVTDKKMAILPDDALLFPGLKHYSLIGSTLDFYQLKNSIVYGTGIMTSSRELKGTPSRIISVRGPRTRDALITKGIDCPEHYGDPALLLPVFYQPDRPKHRLASIIPHCGTLASAVDFDELVRRYNCNLIDMTRYDKWTDIIDGIAGSSFVMSESLHGLIVAEAYGVPSVWVEFTQHNDYWSFKFLDFYESIGKYGMSSLKMYEGFDFEDVMRTKDEWQPGRIDYDTLLSYFPFEIRPEHKKNIPSRLRILREKSLCYNS